MAARMAIIAMTASKPSKVQTRSTYEPVHVSNPKPEVYVSDLGQRFEGGRTDTLAGAQTAPGTGSAAAAAFPNQ